METAVATVEVPEEGRSLEELEAEIGELAAHIDAATCRLLLAIAEFDRREGWGSSGFRSCAHWLGWRLGLDLATARERLRVGRALEMLPRIRAAFAAGEVSYSKVRAMSRVATKENEEDLLAVARHGTAQHLERLTRLFRRGSSAEEGERARRQHEERYLKTWTDEEGMLVIRGRLPAEVGAMVEQALRAAMRALGEQSGAGNETGPLTAEEAKVEGGVATAGVSAETSAREDGPSWRGPGAGVATARVSAETCGPHCADAEEKEEEEEEGGEPEQDPVCVLVPDEPELEEKLLTGPDFCKAEAGTFVPEGAAPRRVRPLVEREGGERARQAADALGLVAEWALAAISAQGARAGEPRGRIEAAGREGSFEVVLHVDAEVLAADTPVGHCEVEGGPRLAAETVRRLCCSAPVVTMLHGEDGELLGPGRRTRRISAPLWRALRSRDRTCQFPGCTARSGLVVHHVRHWAHGGETRLSNTCLLCRSHHWSLHEGGFRVEGRAPGGLTFFTPEGRPLPASPPPPAGSAEALAEKNRELDFRIGPETGLTRWDGEPMGLSWVPRGLVAGRARK